MILGPGGVPLTDTQINGYAQDVIDTVKDGKSRGWRIEQIIPHLVSAGIPKEIVREALWKAYNLPRTTTYLRNMSLSRLHNTAVVLGYQPTGKANKADLVSYIEAHFPKVKGSAPNNEAGLKIVAEAEHWLGTPYSWGGGGPGGPSYGTGKGSRTKGFDCSAFVQYLYAKLGVPLARTTYDQIKAGRSVKDQTLAAGDLLFFGSSKNPHHVGMYIGDGKFIESPYTGSYIKITPISSRRDVVDVRRLI